MVSQPPTWLALTLLTVAAFMLAWLVMVLMTDEDGDDCHDG